MHVNGDFAATMLFVVLATAIGYAVGTICDTPAMGVMLCCAANVVLMLAVAVGAVLAMLDALRTMRIWASEDGDYWIIIGFGPLEWRGQLKRTQVNGDE